MPYVPHTESDRDAMLRAIGATQLDDLFASIPEPLRLRRPLEIPARATEHEILVELRKLAERNRSLDGRPSFLGAGVYQRFIPAAIDALSSRGEFNTAYTPYQAEVSQGTLQAIIEYQTMICQLTGMEIANASMYDGATALAESVLMAYSVHGKGRTVLVSDGVHPEYRRVLETYVKSHPIEIERLALVDDRTPIAAIESSISRDDVFAVVIAQPNFFGALESTDEIARLFAPDAGSSSGSPRRPLLIGVVEPISLGVLAPPGEWNVDIAIGDGQGLGNPPSFGGPSFGFFATRHAHVRKVPGRLVGETRDRDGRRGYVLTFQTREQHIRRERATSNICTNQGLCSLRGAMYLALLGKEGLREVATASTRRAHAAAERLLRVPGVELATSTPFFFEFPIRLPKPAEEVYRDLAGEGIIGGLPLERLVPGRTHEMLIAVTEVTSERDVEALAGALERSLQSDTVDAANARSQTSGARS